MISTTTITSFVLLLAFAPALATAFTLAPTTPASTTTTTTTSRINQQRQKQQQQRRRQGHALAANGNDNWDSNNDINPNDWASSSSSNMKDDSDWQAALQQKQDGTFWSSFEPATNVNDDDDDDVNMNNVGTVVDDENRQADAWLDTLASLSAEEVEFNLKEADRADKVRQMQEWGFDSNIIQNTLGVATDTSLETVDDLDGMQLYREESYLETVDMETVESHTMVPIDEETGEPIRQQMVYVDEHTCIGCTNCAMIAQSTFFMHSEHGRARVFQQWGDDEETIQIAIETCPVDCIHYVPFDELKALEKDRRNQNINFKARLVSQAENGNSLSHRVGGGQFTAPQQISGNMAPRCNNCPSRGCKNCPMFGIGKNPEYERKEQARKARIERRKLEQERETAQKSAEL